MGDSAQPLLKKKFAGQSLGFWLSILISVVIASAFFGYPPAVMTNRAYLRDLLKAEIFEKTSSGVVASMKESEDPSQTTELEWINMEQELGDCMIADARIYLESDDPYLRSRANMETPVILAKMFLGACLPDLDGVVPTSNDLDFLRREVEERKTQKMERSD